MNQVFAYPRLDEVIRSYNYFSKHQTCTDNRSNHKTADGLGVHSLGFYVIVRLSLESGDDEYDHAQPEYLSAPTKK